MATKARYDNSWVRRSQSEPRMRLERAFPPPFLRCVRPSALSCGGNCRAFGDGVSAPPQSRLAVYGAAVPSDHLPTTTMNSAIGSGESGAAPPITGESGTSAPHAALSMRGTSNIRWDRL
jgi:hypothetical protein